MTKPFIFQRIVEFRDTDAAGIMHFSVFFTCMEQAEHAFLRHIGLSVMTEHQGMHVSWPRVSAGCDFEKPVRFEDELEVHVVVDKIGKRSVTYGFEFQSSLQRVACGRIVAACCDVSPGKPPKSIAIPLYFQDALRPYLRPRDT